MNTKEQIAKQCVYLCLMDKITPQKKIECIIEMLDNLEKEIKETMKPKEVKPKVIIHKPKVIIQKPIKKLVNNGSRDRMLWIHKRIKALRGFPKYLKYEKALTQAIMDWNKR